MCNWEKWIWPGILATVILTALAMLMKSGSLEQYSADNSVHNLPAQYSWMNVTFGANPQDRSFEIYEGVSSTAASAATVERTQTKANS